MRKFFDKEEIDQVLTNRRSDYSKQGLINDFKLTDHPYHEIPDDYNLRTAVQAVTDQFRPNRVLHPIQYPDLRYYPWTLNVSAEAPWTLSKFKFTPMDRSVDHESTQPKLIFDIRQRNKLRKWHKPTDVRTYLAWKQSIGLTTNDAISFHNLYDEIFIYNRPHCILRNQNRKPLLNHIMEPRTTTNFHQPLRQKETRHFNILNHSLN